MIGVKHTKKAHVVHEVRPDRTVGGWGEVDRRDASDFLLQVEREYERIEGKLPTSDDAYTVRGNEEGLVASWTSPMQPTFPPRYAEAHTLLTRVAAKLTAHQFLDEHDELANDIGSFLERTAAEKP